MKKINVLHIAEIDNDLSKGTSSIIPQYIIEQDKNVNINVAFLNCNHNNIESLKKITHTYTISDNFTSIIESFSPDIVIFHELYKASYLKIYKFLKKRHIPYIIIPHGGMTKKAQGTKKIKKIIANALLFNDFFYNADKIQYLSVSEKNNTKFKNLNYYILGNGISNIPMENEYLKKFNEEKKNDGKLNLIYVGRYDYYIKGLDQLLNAMKIIKEKNITNVSLELYGKGTTDNYNLLRKTIDENNLSEIVKLNGPVFGKDKIEKILNSDVFVQVSRTEGQPLGVMEAISLGMPVILSEGTGYKDIINKEKIGVSTANNEIDISNSIIYMQQNKKNLDTFSANSFNFAKKNYNWEYIVNSALNTYMEIIEK